MTLFEWFLLFSHIDFADILIHDFDFDRVQVIAIIVLAFEATLPHYVRWRYCCVTAACSGYLKTQVPRRIDPRYSWRITPYESPSDIPDGEDSGAPETADTVPPLTELHNCHDAVVPQQHAARKLGGRLVVGRLRRRCRLGLHRRSKPPRQSGPKSGSSPCPTNPGSTDCVKLLDKFLSITEQVPYPRGLVLTRGDRLVPSVVTATAVTSLVWPLKLPLSMSAVAKSQTQDSCFTDKPICGPGVEDLRCISA